MDPEARTAYNAELDAALAVSLITTKACVNSSLCCVWVVRRIVCNSGAGRRPGGELMGVCTVQLLYALLQEAGPNARMAVWPRSSQSTHNSSCCSHA